MLAFEAHALLAPHALHDLRRLVEGAQPIGERRERTAVRFELRAEPARAEPDDRPSMRDVVDGRDLFREYRGIAEEGRADERPELGALRDRGHRRELAPRLENGKRRHRHAVEVVADPERVEAEPLELDRRRAGLVPRALDLREGDPEAGSSCLCHGGEP